VSLYLDASVIVPTLVPEARSLTALAFLRSASDDLLVSEYAASEVASAISRLLRLREVDLAAADAALDQFDEWRRSDTKVADIIRVDFDNMSRLVRRFELKLRSPDALHLAISIRLGATLVTADGNLARAARDCATPIVRI
jgi:hypothetical protein